MATSKPSFEDRIAVLSAELGEIGKRPISADSYSELVSVQERLEDIVGEFILCDSCGEMFPSVVQIVIEGESATLCKDCAITAIQRDTLTTGAPPADKSNGSGSRTAERARLSKPVEPAADADESDDDVEVDEDLPMPVQSRPRARSRARAPRAPSVEADDDADAPSSGESTAVRGTGAPMDASYITQEPVTGPFKFSDSPSTSSVDDILSAPRSRTARPPQDEEPVVKEKYSDVAKYLDCKAKDVRQIGKLVKEISPPMNTEKTTRYVLAELRNIRSKIPQDVVPRIVTVLKEGIPSEGNGNGNQ